VIVSFGEEWSIDGEPLTSFAGGLRDRQVTTRHANRDRLGRSRKRLAARFAEEVACRRKPSPHRRR
jgi:hypothetical protein